MKFRPWTLATLMLFAGAMASPLPRPGTKLYVTNSQGDSITVIDLGTLKVVGDIQVGKHVHGVAVQADGRRLFTTIESDNSLEIIDTATNRNVASIKLTGRPNQCAVTPDGKFVAVPIRDKDSVDIVDVAQRKVVKTLPVRLPHNCLNAGSNRYLFVSSMGDGEIDRIDLTTMQYAGKIPVGGVPRPYAITRDGRTMYVALSDLHGFAVVSIPEDRIVERVQAPSEHPHAHPRPFEPIDTLTHGLALTPDEKELWFTSLLDDCVYVYDLGANKITGRVATGDGPNWIAFSPDGTYCCVSNSDSDDCSIIDTRTRREVARVKVGRVPKRLVVAIVPNAAGSVRAARR